jgi:hypothetical protein
VTFRNARPVRGWLVALVLAILAFVVPLPAWAVEQFYSRDLYPRLQSLVTAGSNLVPVAVLDGLVALALVLTAVRVVRLTSAARKRGVLSAAREGLTRLIRAVAAVALVFMFVWGCNYRRQPLESALGGVDAHPDETTVVAAVSDAGRLATRLRPAAMAAMPPTLDRAADLLRDPMNKALARLNREPLARPGRPKISHVLSPFFTWAGVDGMINPLALESIVHKDLLPFERPYVLAHEWAHLSGHGDEAEASAVGWFACMHGSPPLAYSASLYLVMEGAAALRGPSRARALSTLDAGVRGDLEAIRQRLLRQQPQVRQATSKVYDRYLKANRVEDGTASYGRALTVILSPALRGVLTSY